MSQAFFDREKLLPVHHSVKPNKESVEKLTEEIRTMSKIAQETIAHLRQESHEKANKTRIDKNFEPNDIVFVLDRYIIPGNNRPLKSKFFPSPYVVLKPYFTTCLVRRLADNFTALYSKDDLKLYKGTDPIFATLPPQVNEVLLHGFLELVDSDYVTLLKFDPLDVPTGLSLIDTVDPKEPNDFEIFSHIKPVDNLKDEFVTDNEFLPFQEPRSKPAQQDPEPQENDVDDDVVPDEVVERPLRPVTRSQTAKQKIVNETLTNKNIPDLPTNHLFLEPINEQEEAT
jgi:hypothetical protein